MLLFHVPYTMMQYVGLGFLFSLYIFQGVKFLIWDLPREKKREAALAAEVQQVEKALKEARTRSVISNIGGTATTPASCTDGSNRP